MDPIGLARPVPLRHGSLYEGRLEQAARRGNVTARRQLHQLWHQMIDQEVDQQDSGGLQMALPQAARRWRQEPDDECAGYRLHAMAQRAEALGDRRLQARIRRVRMGDTVRVRPQCQPAHSDWCGITSVAMVTEKMTGRRTSPDDIHSRYGYGLRDALQSETGRTWQDRAFNHDLWLSIEASLRRGRPVVMGTGKPFSCGDRHIFVLVGLRGNEVTYADPNGGVLRKTTRRALEAADPYPQGGKFILVNG